MYATKYTLRAIFSLSLLVSLSACANDSIVTQVLGERPLSSATAEVVDGLATVKDGVVSLGQKIWDGGGRWATWGQNFCKDNGSKIGRVGYQLIKAYAAKYLWFVPLPEMSSLGAAKPVYENSPRAASVVVFVHALRGLIREAGFENITDLYRSAEGLNNSDLN